MKYLITKFAIVFFLFSVSQIALTNNSNNDSNNNEKGECQIEVAFEYEVENLMVRFNNASIGEYDQLQWDFGDKKQSHEANPTHEYTKEGLYRFCVTATNTQRGCNKQFCGELYVFEEPIHQTTNHHSHFIFHF